MVQIDTALTPEKLRGDVQRVFSAAGEKILRLDREWDRGQGTPVYTVNGKYTTRGWTEWTQGFQFGLPILQFDGTGEYSFLELGRRRTVESMAPHVSHTGVHDHGFNNLSTYGNLLRLMKEGRVPQNDWEAEFYRMAIKVSGAVQAARWTGLPGELGYVYTFNGPHSLFVDTIRSMRILGLAHRFGHVLMGEGDRPISLLRRALQHAEATARYNVYFGESRDSYDLRGRTAHEAIFNINNGTFRCPSSQQGYSPFSTWTRGHAWVLCGFAEELEFVSELPDEEFNDLNLPYYQSRTAVLDRFLEVARAVADFYIAQMPADGIPYWDTGAPNLHKLGAYQDKPADPFNDWEPVDSSAAAIAAQGLLRLGRYLEKAGDESGTEYFQAGLTVAETLFKAPYLSTDPGHQGLLLHSIYHRPNGWDHIQPGEKVPNGESCMWGDYHLMELAVYVQRLANEGPYLSFFAVPLKGGVENEDERTNA